MSTASRLVRVSDAAVPGTAAKLRFRDAGHWPTLVAALLYFDFAFMAWVLLGPLAPDIARDLALDPSQQGLLVALPALSGAVLRVPAGMLADRIGPRRAGLAGQLVVLGGLIAASLFGLGSYAALLGAGILLGVAGASFAIALPLAGRWYPPEYQGRALGIAGMGNSGTVLAALFAPSLARLYGCEAVFALICIPLTIVLLLYLLMAREAPGARARKPLRAYFAPLALADSWWLMGFYGVTFGGFVGLAASLTLYFTARFELDTVTAGYCTAACVFAGSLIRPFGGALADRLGGTRVLSVVFLVAGATLGGVALASRVDLALALFVAAMLALGIGNGAVFQLVPQRFAQGAGMMTGLVGMAGGIGGFYLAASLGVARQLTGSYAPGFLVFAALALLALVALRHVAPGWRAHWQGGARI